MKKMKGVAVYEDQRPRLRHQSLLQDYEDLHKETDAMRVKLQAAKQTKLMLSAEVRFLRKRYKYLMKNPSPKPQPKQDISQPRKLIVQALPPNVPKQRNYNRKDSTVGAPIPRRLNPTERIPVGVETSQMTLQKKSHMFDLNQNARSLSKVDQSLPSSIPGLDLNHDDRIHNGKEAPEKLITPIFDLNQISIEEEELLGNTDPAMVEDPKRNTVRGGMSEELHNDIKLSICRNVGNGSSKTVKRKISWLDQVALRV